MCVSVKKELRTMPARILDAYDEAYSRLREAIWEKYASGEQLHTIGPDLSDLHAAYVASRSEPPHSVSPRPYDSIAIGGFNGTARAPGIILNSIASARLAYR